MPAPQEYIIGIDTGGTFTDIVVIDSEGRMSSSKAPTTPGQFELGVLEAIRHVAGLMGMRSSELLERTRMVMHGSTVATNAIITRTGAQVGLITTKGFEDHPLIMRAIGSVDGLDEEEIRHTTAVTKPEPLVPRDLIRGVSERVDYTGQVIVPLDVDGLRHAIQELVEKERIGALAVSFLNAWANPVHEEAARQIVFEMYPDLYCSFGSSLSRVAGEYARTNTAVINSFVGPTVEKYLKNLDRKLRDEGFRGYFLVMQGHGGVSTPDQCPAIANLQSGPAGGMIASAYMAALLRHDRVLTADMGGTSLDVGLFTDGYYAYAEEPIANRFRVLQPMIDIQSIGAGGGTIARVDEATRRLIVGPASAGARPGPVCYDEGGEDVTVTDADLVLGYLNPDYFLGGRKHLNRSKAEQAIRLRIAEPLGMSVPEAALGIYDIINNKMADLMRARVVKSGYLPEEFVLYFFGGAAGVHAAPCARELGIRTVYIFSTASVFSALGAAIADVVHSRVATYKLAMPVPSHLLNDRLESMEAELAAVMEQEGFRKADVDFRWFATLRYRRQTSGVEIALPWARFDEGGVQGMLDMFERKYEDLYGSGAGYREMGIELAGLRVDAVGHLKKPRFQMEDTQGTDPGAARKGWREAYLEGRFQPVELYDYERLKPGMELAGPCIIEASLTTILVPGWASAAVDGFRNVVLRL